MVNEKEGEVVAVGHRSGYMMIVIIAKIGFDTVENRSEVKETEEEDAAFHSVSPLKSFKIPSNMVCFFL